jgi:hypothetical protein
MSNDDWGAPLPPPYPPPERGPRDEELERAWIQGFESGRRAAEDGAAVSEWNKGFVEGYKFAQSGGGLR